MAEEKKKTERYILEEVPTQTAIVIRDTETQAVYSDVAILLEILNKLAKIDAISKV